MDQQSLVITDLNIRTETITIMFNNGQQSTVLFYVWPWQPVWPQNTYLKNSKTGRWNGMKNKGNMENVVETGNITSKCWFR